MTISELYKSVLQLGFETSVESADGFYFAVNRALLQVNAVRPSTRSYIINHKPLDNMVKEPTFSPIEKTEDLCFEAEDVKAYYFEADGNGIAYIERFSNESNNWDTKNPLNQVTLSKSNGFKAYRGLIRNGTNFVSDRIRIRFTGDYLYSVKNVAMYQHIYSGNPNDVPAYEQFSRYDISVLTDDFLSLAAPPIQKDVYGYLDKGYDVENGRIVLLPYEAKGLYKVIYKHKPLAVTHKQNPSEDTKTVLDIDEELAALMPLLVASYIWIDDEPEKAQYYANLYRENAIDIERHQRNYIPAEIQSVNGW